MDGHPYTNVNNRQNHCISPDDVRKALRLSLHTHHTELRQNSESRARLIENCTNHGLQFRGDTLGDGNCFFNAISDQLDRLGLEKLSPAHLRAMVVQRIRHNPIMQRPDGIVDLRQNITEEWDVYCNGMSTSGVYADAIIVTAMAWVLERDFLIITSSLQGGTDNCLTWVVGNPEKHDQPLLLGHIHEVHYQSLTITAMPLPGMALQPAPPDLQQVTHTGAFQVPQQAVLLTKLASDQQLLLSSSNRVVPFTCVTSGQPQSGETSICSPRPSQVSHQGLATVSPKTSVLNPQHEVKIMPHIIIEKVSRQAVQWIPPKRVVPFSCVTSGQPQSGRTSICSTRPSQVYHQGFAFVTRKTSVLNPQHGVMTMPHTMTAKVSQQAGQWIPPKRVVPFSCVTSGQPQSGRPSICSPRPSQVSHQGLASVTPKTSVLNPQQIPSSGVMLTSSTPNPQSPSPKGECVPLSATLHTPSLSVPKCTISLLSKKQTGSKVPCSRMVTVSSMVTSNVSCPAHTTVSVVPSSDVPPPAVAVPCCSESSTTSQDPQPIEQPNSTASNIRPFHTRIQKPEYTGARCCVFGCSNRRGEDIRKNIKRSYHVIPADAERRELWLKAIPRQWTPSKYSTICGDHFVGGKPSRARDSPAYIPTIFPTKKPAAPRQTATSQRAGTEVPPASIPKKRKVERNAPREHTGFESIDHDYLKTRPCTGPVSDETEDLHRRLQLAEEKAAKADRLPSLENIKQNATKFMFYTGMPNYPTFKGVFDYLIRRSHGNLRYWRGADTDVFQHFTEGNGRKPGPKRKLDLETEFYLTLVRLRTGKFYADIAQENDISQSLASRTFTTWINFLAVELKQLFQMKVNLDDQETIPTCYHPYESLKLVIDCTELISQMSSNFDARKQSYSNYKSRDTVKFMVGLSPNLTVNYVSLAYGGRASDKFITLESSSLLENLPPGSQVMADRGFRVEEELKRLGVELIIPCFKGSDRSQLPKAEVQSSEQIAMARIHIERVIQRIRSYHILDSTIKLSQKDVVEQTFTVCCYLVNFQTPIKDLIKSKKQSQQTPCHLNGVDFDMKEEQPFSSNIIDVLEPLQVSPQ